MDKKVFSVSDFLKTPAGAVLSAWESEQVGLVAEESFGRAALQVGFPEIDFLARTRIQSKFRSAESARALSSHPALSAPLLAEAAELPFAGESLDLVVLPHTLNFSGGDSSSQHILREVFRVLVPEGRVVITAFNPASLWGMKQKCSLAGFGAPFLPSDTNLISLPRLRDWCSVLGFEIDRGRFGLYQPACRTMRTMKNYDWMNRAGDRWWPSLAGIVMLSACKRLESPKLVGAARRFAVPGLGVMAGPSPVSSSSSSSCEGRSGA